MTGRPAMIRAAMLTSSALAIFAIPTMAYAETVAAESTAGSLPVSAAAAAADDAATGIIEGLVTDASGRFVNGAEVRLDSSNVVTTTDREGRFRMTRVPSGA